QRVQEACQVAEQHAAPAGTSFFFFFQAADGIRDFDPLHYVWIPEAASGYDQGRDCPERNCMVEALKWFSAVIAEKNAPIMMRRLALHYAAHLVGDMHQPLHAGRAMDQGGIDILVSYRGGTTNLHFFWDTNLVELETGN